DQPGNVLVPMWWERSLNACAGQTLRVHGEVRSPCTLQIPPDDVNVPPHRNTWLESYTFDGRRNVPPFETETLSNSALNGCDGTTDEPFSVLRFGVNYGRCSSSPTNLCNHNPDQCPSVGDTCDPICTDNSNAPCGATQPCSGGVKCGKLHDFRP